MTARECRDLAREIEQTFEGVECWYDELTYHFMVCSDDRRPILIPTTYYQALWGFAVLIQPSEPIPGEVCEIEWTGEGESLPSIVDRDALLAVAETLEDCACRDSDLTALGCSCLAKRILEACGGLPC